MVFGRGDMGRTPMLTRTDLLVSHGFVVMGDKQLRLELNVLNLFNQKTSRHIFNFLQQGRDHPRPRVVVHRPVGHGPDAGLQRRCAHSRRRLTVSPTRATRASGRTTCSRTARARYFTVKFAVLASTLPAPAGSRERHARGLRPPSCSVRSFRLMPTATRKPAATGELPRAFGPGFRADGGEALLVFPRARFVTGMGSSALIQ